MKRKRKRRRTVKRTKGKYGESGRFIILTHY